MTIALSMFCGKNKFSILLPIVAGLLFWNDVSPFIIFSYILIYYFTNKSLIKSNLIFYLITNYGCWLFWYPLTAEGFLKCYLLALPFLVRAYLISFMCLKTMEICYEKVLGGSGRVSVVSISNVLGRYRRTN